MTQQLINFTLIIFFFLFPLFFLPITPESYEVNKMLLLIITSLILSVFYTIKIIQQKKIIFVKSSFGLLFFLFTIMIVISALFQSPNMAVAFTTPLSVGTILAGFLLYLALVNNKDFCGEAIEKKKRGEGWREMTSSLDPAEGGAHPESRCNRDGGTLAFEDSLSRHPTSARMIPMLMSILILDAALISLFVIFLYTGLLPENPYTPAGNLLSSTSFLAIMAFYIILEIIEKAKPKETIPIRSGFVSEDLLQINMYILAFIPIAIALIILIFHLTTDTKPAILPFFFGWKIFLEILRNIKTLLLGIGPANFLTAFTLAKPASINSTPFWNIIFTSSSSYFLNLATETGLVAAFLYLLILLKAVILFKAKPKETIPIRSGFVSEDLPQIQVAGPASLLFALLLQIFLPSSVTVFILTVILLAFAAYKEPVEIKLGRLSYFLILPAALFILLTSYLTGRWYLSEVAFKNSLDAMLNNQGTRVYERQKEAVALNPASDRYHLALSQTSFRLANSLAAKKELTGDDKQNIPKLIQQAIEEAQMAVRLGRSNIANWNNLARVYTSLINFAAGVDKWAVESQRQKILLDPNNPNHRIALGSLYLSLKNYHEAETSLREAIALKPDLAQAHFLLAAVYKEEKKYKEAYQELQITRPLVPSDSEDAKKIEEEISKLDTR